MRFVEQNKKRTNPKYFLNEESESPDSWRKTSPEREAAFKRALSLGDRGTQKTTPPAAPMPSAAEPTQKISGTNIQLDPKTKIKNIQANLNTLKFAAIPDNEMGIVGPKTINGIRRSLNAVTNETPHSETYLSAKQKLIDRKEILSNLDFYENLTKDVVYSKSWESLAKAKAELKKAGEKRTFNIGDEKISGTTSQKSPLDLSPEEIGPVRESKLRDASYNRINEQKQKKLFEALIKG